MAGSTVETQTPGYATAFVSINGTYGASSVVNFEVSDDGGTNWFPQNCVATNGTTLAASATLSANTAYAYDCGVAGTLRFRVRLSSYVSGAISVGITISPLLASNLLAPGAHTVFTSNYNTPAIPSGSGNYMPLSGSMGSMLTNETNAKTIVASPMTITSITAWVSAAETSTNTLAVTLNDNGSATAATCAISAGTNPCVLTGLAVAVNAQDLLDFQIAQNGTGTSQRLTVSVAYD
jgi:hypothetical protein